MNEETKPGLSAEEIIKRDYHAIGSGGYQLKDYRSNPRVHSYESLMCMILKEQNTALQQENQRLQAELTKSTDALLHYSETVLNDMDIKLNEANQRGEKLNSVARNVLKEATKVYCHYNEIIKNKNESMDFKTLKELDAALSQYESTKVK